MHPLKAKLFQENMYKFSFPTPLNSNFYSKKTCSLFHFLHIIKATFHLGKQRHNTFEVINFMPVFHFIHETLLLNIVSSSKKSHYYMSIFPRRVINKTPTSIRCKIWTNLQECTFCCIKIRVYPKAYFPNKYVQTTTKH